MRMRVLAYDPFPKHETARELGFEYSDLDRLYREADVISLHAPLTRETFHMIDWVTIAKMKPNVMIVNTSRGALINTRDLIEALKRGRIGSAGLDVYEEEEACFFEDRSGTIISDDVLARLLTFPNVLITAHQAFLTQEALLGIAQTTLRNVEQFVNGEALPNEITLRKGSAGTH
jgi:D-lactate dehydrogenase